MSNRSQLCVRAVPCTLPRFKEYPFVPRVPVQPLTRLTKPRYLSCVLRSLCISPEGIHSVLLSLSFSLYNRKCQKAPRSTLSGEKRGLGSKRNLFGVAWLLEGTWLILVYFNNARFHPAAFGLASTTVQTGAVCGAGVQVELKLYLNSIQTLKWPLKFRR